MRLEIFASAWSFGSLERCRREVESGVFDGIEGPPPEELAACRNLASDATPYIAEVCTGGSYAPASSVSESLHWEDLQAGLERAATARARFVTCLTGSDSWPLSQAIDYLGRALELARRLDLALCVETHRSRPTFNPWATRELCSALPELRLTCDFSHWCVVCERLLEEDDPALELAIARAGHAHARVGYAQGPQVPDPRAPEYALELERHERWWTRIWSQARARGAAAVTMTPEFGPDGYLHHAPFVNRPVADLDELNRWMAARLRERFEHWNR